MDAKKIFMIHFWRIQQCQTIISVLFWSATLAGIFYPYLSPWFVKLGFLRSEHVGFGLILIFLMVFGIISLFGYIYDIYLKLWIEMNIVTIERDIYNRTKQSAKEIVHWQYFYIPLLRSVGKVHEANFFENWNERCLDEDPRLRKDTYDIIRWVLEYQLKPLDERGLKDIKVEFWKNIKEEEFKSFEQEARGG
jgi:hypothetical protein